VKRTHAVFIITVFFLLFFLPIVLPSGTVSAQSTGYTIDKVDHSIEVMYSGQIVVRDTIHVSGQITSSFMIGLPSKYSASVLKAVAYDTNNVYQVNTGVQLGDRSGFYGAQINFNGNTPSVFTVAFVLSNSLITFDENSGTYTLDFPAYPSLTQDVASCNVTITLPGTAQSMIITKSDGEVDASNYITSNLAAYTYLVGSAAFQIPTGTMELANIDNLNSQITIDPNGKVSASDSFQFTNNATSTMTSFVFNLPSVASNVIVKDEFGRTLTISTDNVRDILLANATLVTFLGNGQSTVITVNYNLPSATIKGSQYALNNFRLFPDFYYYVEQATFTFTPPEGAKIANPQISSLDPYSTITRSTFQDSLTITRNGISYVDYASPESNMVQFSYDYNPVWVSFRPTFWASLLGVILCFGVVIIRRNKRGEKETVSIRPAKVSQKTTSTGVSQQIKEVGPSTGQRVTSENLREFTDAYEEKKQLNAELKSMDARAQKGKIPRRQYKVQRKTIEIRLETLTRNINKLKDALRSSSAANADLVQQLDSAEEEMNDAEENIKKLEVGQSKGEISLETYKKNIGEYQKRKDKAESTINGILLRLREKSR